MRVLFATSEFDDFVRVGGLAAVAAALPRALSSKADVRVIIPGYSSLLENTREIQIVGACPAVAELPACQIGLTRTSDSLAVYIVLCSQLYEREGSPYTDDQGVDWGDNDLRFARFASAAAILAEGKVDPAWSADLVHTNDWQAALVPAYLAWNGSS